MSENFKKYIIPTLSEKGYVESPEGLLDKLLSYYFLTEGGQGAAGGQSLTFKNSLRSLPTTYAKYINEPHKFEEQLKMELGQLLRSRFDDVEIETVVRFDPSGTKADVGLFATVIDHHGNKHNLGKLSRMDATLEGGGTFSSLVDYSNFGDMKRKLNYG